MPDTFGWLVLLGTALAASILGGVAGFGAGVVLLPVVAWTLGLRAAVPVLTVTMLVGNLSRLWWSRGEVDRAASVRFLAGAVPATALGAVLYAGTPTTALSLVIGAFLLASVPLRRFLFTPIVQVRLRHFPIIGAVFGFLSSLVVATGPVVTPFFLAYGLRRGAYIATEAVCAFGMHLTRGVVLTRYALLTWDTIAIGCVLGGTMFAGSWLGRRLLDRMSDRVFLHVIEALLIVMGLHFLLYPR
ncbi:MAG: sulfite exporter TauE/SafE family protein [Candidatus Rokubacteria bacterium]|nr:sulfite exporter TauE/SafE family protein [Candidatus Rokubacteria bacterium]